MKVVFSAYPPTMYAFKRKKDSFFARFHECFREKNAKIHKMGLPCTSLLRFYAIFYSFVSQGLFFNLQLF